MREIQQKYCISFFIFIAATLAIAGVFYEGMELKWFGIVGMNEMPIECAVRELREETGIEFYNLDI